MASDSKIGSVRDCIHRFTTLKALCCRYIYKSAQKFELIRADINIEGYKSLSQVTVETLPWRGTDSFAKLIIPQKIKIVIKIEHHKFYTLDH